MRMIVAVAGEKGGCGKTSLAVHLSGWRACAGRDVMLVDADRQGSASMWVDSRIERQLPAPSTVRQFDAGLRRAVRDLARRYEDVVVDIGSGDGAAIEAVMREAHTVIVPVQPNGMDVWTIDLLDELACEAQDVNDGLRVCSVINRASTHHASRDLRAAQQELRRYRDVEHSELVIRERTSIRRAVPAGLLIDEYRPVDPKGIAELRAVFEHVFDSTPKLPDAALT